MVKARIIVNGTVQGTGYRALVKNYANRRGLNGIVRNLPDGKVEIFLEGTKNNIEQLTKDINVKGSPTNPLSLNVENLSISWEGDKDFKKAWKRYSDFEIDYGPEKLTPFEKENLESLEWAKLRFSMLEDGINSFRAESNQNFKALDNGICSFRDQTHENFNTMGGKYDAISTDVKATKQELTTSLDKLPDRIGESLTKHLKKLLKK